MTQTGLDIETAARPGFPMEYALQPWRYEEGSAVITSVCIGDRLFARDGSMETKYPDSTLLYEVREYLDAHLDDTYVTWNGIFDIAWLYAAGLEVQRYNWLDAMLLWKWWKRSQRTDEGQWSWSLVAAVTRRLAYLQNARPKEEQLSRIDEGMERYVALKETEHEAGDDDEYWQERCLGDAKYTKELGEWYWSNLSDQQRRSAAIEALCLVPFATSWVDGIRLDVGAASRVEPVISLEMYEIESKLGLLNYGDRVWIPSKILSSPKKKMNLLYETWGLTCTRWNDVTVAQREKFEERGEPVPQHGSSSTDKAAVTYLSDFDDRCLDLLRWAKLYKQLTTFIRGIAKARDYLSSDVCHPSPRLYSTKTGRVTYSAKIRTRGGEKHIGVAIHQTPREKEVRRLYLPPEGHVLVEFDASGQEARFMAELSQDSAMLGVFRDGRKYHANTAAAICGDSYDGFMSQYNTGDEAYVGPFGFYNQGKFTGLSCQYRIGDRKLRVKARVEYGMTISHETAESWRRTWKCAYPGVPEYWQMSIAEAQLHGYARTWADRRYGLEKWSIEEYLWGTESNAINHPIQGAGADQKELAIAVLARKQPLLHFGFDLHDGLFYYLRTNTPNLLDVIRQGKHLLDTLPYKEMWGWTPSIPLPWDAAYGPNWGEMEKVT